MGEKRREAVLWLAAAALLAAVSLAAGAGLPDWSPAERIIYASSSCEAAPSSPSTSPAMSSAPTVSAAGLIDLNTADKAQLMTLDGVGEVIAQRILDYRESHGGFASVDELLEVEGIGEKRLAAWRPYLTVGGTTETSKKP